MKNIFFFLRNTCYDSMILCRGKPNVIIDVKPSEASVIYQECLRAFSGGQVTYCPGLALQSLNGEISFEKLRAGFPEEVVKAVSTETHLAVQTPLKKLIEDLQSGSAKEMLFSSTFFERYAELRKEVDSWTWLPAAKLQKKVNYCRLLFAHAKGMLTKLHADFGASLSVQLEGRKTWYLIPSGETVKLMPEVSWNFFLISQRYRSAEDILGKNLGLTIYKVVLEPGDVLYCPPLMWHLTTSETASLSASIKWSTFLTALTKPFLSFIILTARNPSIFGFFRKKTHEPERF